MKYKLIALLALSTLTGVLSAQTTVITGVITDSDSQLWANCQWSAKVVSPNGLPTISGIPISATSLIANGTCNNFGVISATIARTSSFDQSGAGWQFTINPNASAAGYTAPAFATTSSSMTVTTQLIIGIVAPRFFAGPRAFGYADGEVLQPITLGSTYINTLAINAPVLRQYNLTGWSGISSGTGGSGALSGALVDYNFLQGSGTTVIDNSGNGNNGTFGAGAQAPTWISNGLVFSTSGTPQGVSMPVAVNAAKTLLFAVYITPITTNLANPFATVNQYTSLLSSSTGGTGFNLSYLKSVSSSNFEAPWVWAPTLYVNNSHATATSQLLPGLHIIGLVLGTGGGNLDHVYVDGVEAASYVSQGSSAGAQASGNMWLGSSNVAPWTSSGLNGTYYRFVAFTSQLTATQIQSATGAILSDVTNRGVPYQPPPVNLITPQLHAIGDSITYGYGASNGWPALLSLTNQPSYTISNWGDVGVTADAITGADPYRVAPRCQTTSGPAIATVFMGTNDFSAVTGGVTAPQVFAKIATEIQILKRAGCRVYVMTMISRTGTDTLSNSYDADKNTLDALILTSAKSAGADGIIDGAANPLLGADGANTNATYFQSDHVHPTNAGQALLATAASNSLNYYFGSNVSNPTVVTSNTYQMLSGDGAVTAAPTASAAYTMPDCTGPSGETYTISNPQSAQILTVVGGTSQPINGLSSAITIASNSTVTLKDVANPKSSSGCHWVM